MWRARSAPLPPAQREGRDDFNTWRGLKNTKKNFFSFPRCYQQFGIYTRALHHYPSRSQLFKALMQTTCRTGPSPAAWAGWDGNGRGGESQQTDLLSTKHNSTHFSCIVGSSRSSKLFKKNTWPKLSICLTWWKSECYFLLYCPYSTSTRIFFFLLFPTDFTVVNSVYELSDTFLAILLTTVLSGNFKAPLFWQVEISIFE